VRIDKRAERGTADGGRARDGQAREALGRQLEIRGRGHGLAAPVEPGLQTLNEPQLANFGLEHVRAHLMVDVHRLAEQLRDLAPVV